MRHHLVVDLAEQLGTASAGPRLAEQEAEQAQLNARLQKLVLQQEAQGFVVSPEVVQTMLTGLHHTLAGGDLRAKQPCSPRWWPRSRWGKRGPGCRIRFRCELSEN
jgi:hypothetical protein